MRHYLTACSILKNERDFIIEWMAYHRIMGVEYFYFYDNDSEDGIQDFLAPLVRLGFCEIKTWSRSTPELARQPQIMAYRDAIERHKRDTEWMAIIDLDEFIVPLDGTDIPGTLRRRFVHHDQVSINWRIFGSSGAIAAGSEPVIERFRLATHADMPANVNVKSIVRPSGIETAFIHKHEPSDGKTAVDSAGTILDPRHTAVIVSPPVYDAFQVNHYYCKSRQEFEKKRVRGSAADDLNRPKTMEAFVLHDINDCEDLSAYRFLDATKREMAVLQAAMVDTTARVPKRRASARKGLDKTAVKTGKTRRVSEEAGAGIRLQPATRAKSAPVDTSPAATGTRRTTAARPRRARKPAPAIEERP